MATETKDKKIVVKITNGPGTFSLAIALFQPGPQHVVEFECQPFGLVGYCEGSEVRAMRVFISTAENTGVHKIEKRYWKFSGEIRHFSVDSSWTSPEEMWFHQSPADVDKILPRYFTCIYDLKNRKGQMVLTKNKDTD